MKTYSTFSMDEFINLAEPELDSLTHIELQGTFDSLTTEQATRLQTSFTKLHHAESLKFDCACFSHLTPEALSGLFSAFNALKHFNHLGLESAELACLSEAQRQAIFKPLASHPTLQSISLKDNQLAKNDLEHLTQILSLLKESNVQHLNLSDNALYALETHPSETIACFFKAFSEFSQQLKHIDLSLNGLGRLNTSLLANIGKVLSGPQVNSIHLDFNLLENLTEEQMDALLGSLKDAQNLTTLSIQGNGINSLSSQLQSALFQNLAHCKALERLDLIKNCLTKDTTSTFMPCFMAQNAPLLTELHGLDTPSTKALLNENKKAIGLFYTQMGHQLADYYMGEGKPALPAEICQTIVKAISPKPERIPMVWSGFDQEVRKNKRHRPNM